MFDKLKKCEWKIAIRSRSGNLLFEQGGCEKEFIVLKNTVRYWCADPFLIEYNGSKYIFFELYDRFKRKGLIGYREIKNNKIGKIRKAFETNAHLSYPFIFEQDDRLFIIPESNNLNKIILLKSIDNKKRLKFKQVKILANLPAADSTFISADAVNYMFTTPVTDNDNVSKLYIYTEKDGNWMPLNINPVVSNKASARMAGKIIRFNDKLVRCSQNCSSTYGGGLVFSEIVELSADKYLENQICDISPDDVKLKGVKGKIDGIHTYNSDNEYEVIDCKNNAKFSLCECIGHVLEKLHLIKKVTRKKGTQ